MPSKFARAVACTMVVLACTLALSWGYKGTATMAKHIVTVAPKALTTGTTTQPAATTAVAIAPHTHAVPTLPSTQPAANWQLVGKPSTAKRATGGVGPCPGPSTVGYAALKAIAAGGKVGATLAAIAAAVAACNTVKPHKVMPLLTWLAANRGYSFTCTNGMVQCSNLPSGL